MDINSVLPDKASALFFNAAEKGLLPADREKYNAAAYSRLLQLTAADFTQIDNVSHGLENRIFQAIRDNISLEDCIAAIKSKRYTMARLRQILTAAVLGVNREDVESPPTYLRVLAFNETGRKLLSELRDSVSIPLVTNLSDIKRNAACARDLAIECTADKLFDLCLPVPRGGNRPFLSHPIYIKNGAEP